MNNRRYLYEEGDILYSSAYLASIMILECQTMSYMYTAMDLQTGKIGNLLASGVHTWYKKQ